MPLCNAQILPYCIAIKLDQYLIIAKPEFADILEFSNANAQFH
jgi:hypothetical protein